MDGLGTVSHSSVYQVLWDERGSWKDLVNIGLQDVSLVYYLGVVAYNPSSFSLTSLTVLRESAQSFAWTIYRVFQYDKSLNEKIRFVQDYYNLLEMRNSIVDGYLPYPAPECVDIQGMKVEFRNVSMRYPKTTTYALKNVSFTIPAGATVILVGANGSGKTTTVSLLSRLLDTSSGEILIDDRPISTYDVQSLRDAQAVLRQSYQHFPFSIKENIGIGDPMWLELADKHGAQAIEERIMRAAKLGGADEIIEEVKEKHQKRGEALKNMKKKSAESKNTNIVGKAVESKEKGGEDADGWDVNVTPVTTWEGSWQLQGTKLSDMSEEVEKKIELSGGQWQRLALARLFMRAERDQVRLVCSDEPSAALDPKAEYGTSLCGDIACDWVLISGYRRVPESERVAWSKNHEDIYHASVWSFDQACRPDSMSQEGYVPLLTSLVHMLIRCRRACRSRDTRRIDEDKRRVRDTVQHSSTSVLYMIDESGDM